ncbi:ATPase [Hyphomicrobiales bacterium]|jgi:AAA+ superfamily predicted ATPase|nr:ATPase [Hyphomicrobiales bacterium]CAH1702946.1 IstB-like ATP binding family protein [Hyphomicrobiales bacterium]CAI0347131.1 ATPase [Hyphomicrobiales bacterium]
MNRDTLKNLIAAGVAGDTILLKELAQSAAEQLGDRELMAEVDEIFGLSRELPIGLAPLKPKKSLTDLKLPPEVAVIVEEFMVEVRHAEALKRRKLDPRHKALLIGPPGNGKTVLATAIAVELGLPAYMVRYDDLISKTPGETSRNLLRLFSYAARQPSMLFFDEFDALGRERDNDQESGEMKRVVSTLLVQLDDVPSHVVCMAATNHAGMLDSAIWRRFNIRIELPRPKLERFAPFMEDEFKRYGFEPDPGKVDLLDAAMRIQPDHFSDAELFTRNAMRAFVVAEDRGAPITIEDAIARELDTWANGQTRLV